MRRHVIPHELHRLSGDDGFLWGRDLNSDERMDDISGFSRKPRLPPAI